MKVTNMGQAVGKKYFINSKTSSGKDKGPALEL